MIFILHIFFRLFDVKSYLSLARLTHSKAIKWLFLNKFCRLSCCCWTNYFGQTEIVFTLSVFIQKNWILFSATIPYRFFQHVINLTISVNLLRCSLTRSRPPSIFNETRFVLTNLLYTFDWLNTLSLPIIHIIIWFWFLKPFQDHIVFIANLLSLLNAHSSVQTWLNWTVSNITFPACIPSYGTRSNCVIRHS